MGRGCYTRIPKVIVRMPGRVCALVGRCESTSRAGGYRGRSVAWRIGVAMVLCVNRIGCRLMDMRKEVCRHCQRARKIESCGRRWSLSIRYGHEKLERRAVECNSMSICG